MKQRHLRKKKEDRGVEGAPTDSQERRLGALSFDVEDIPQTTKKRSLKRASLAHLKEKVDKPAEEVGEKPGRQKTENEVAEIRVSGSFKPVMRESQSPVAFHRVTFGHSTHAVTDSKKADEDVFEPPDTLIIEMAKEKRVRLRQAQLAPDYLPLGGTSELLRQAIPEKEDRSSGSDAEEDHMRLKFAGHISSIPKVDEEMDLDVMEDEDAVDSFVNAQIKKGISALGRSEIKSEKKKSSDVEEGVVALPVITHGHLREKVGRSRQRLENARSKQQERRTMTQASLQHARNILEQSEKDSHRLKQATEKTEQQYLEVQELRAYVDDLSLCLKEKLPFVEEMENHIHRSEEDLNILDTEWRLDELDRRSIEAAAAAVVDALSNEESQERASDVAAVAVKAIDNAATPSSTADLHMVTERRRMAKKVASEGYIHRLPNLRMTALELGDDIKEIEEEVNKVFSDALPEFASVSAVVGRFYGLKTRHPKLYRMATIPDSLPELLATFVRLDVLTWRPLRGTPLGLEQQSWYRALEHFGDQEEEHLVPELVKRVALPTAVKHSEACWSPYDYERTNIVAEMLREMLVYVPMEEEAMQNLLKGIRQRLKECVTSAGVSSVTGSVFRASEVVQSIMEVQYQRMLQLIDSLLCFDGLLPSDTLQEMVMGQLMIEKCLPYLTAVSEMKGVLQKTTKLMSVIPESMLSSSPNASRQVLEFLKRFRRKVERRGEMEDALELDKLSMMIERLEWDS